MKHFLVISLKFLVREFSNFVFSLKTQNSRLRRGFGGQAKLKTNQGFTLVELLVAVSLFTVVALVSVSTLLSLTAANRKAQALQAVMNNLNVSLDGMVRSIRMGSDYSCKSTPFSGDGTDDCRALPSILFSFEPFHTGEEAVPRWIYKFENARMLRSKDNGNNWEFLTAPEISIEDMKFYVAGTDRTDDTEQPKVVITIRGIASAADVKAATTFNIQATAVQRLLDL